MSEDHFDTASLSGSVPQNWRSKINWRPMEVAPRDGTDVLLFTREHGAVQGHFVAGYWDHGFEVSEYNGSVWVCGDVLDEIDVVEYDCPETGLRCYEEDVVCWLPLDELGVFP